MDFATLILIPILKTQTTTSNPQFMGELYFNLVGTRLQKTVLIGLSLNCSMQINIWGNIGK